MTVTTTQKRAVEQYYKDLAAYAEKHVTHETAVRSAFQNLLAAFAQSANWVLIPEQAIGSGKRPDGTLRDTFNLPRGYWEAKDGHDDLQIEIRKKISLGYPISNTIFEDTRRAILYQNNRVAFEADLTNPKDLTAVLDTFFHYAAPDIATFEHAVADFKESIPDLAQGLMQRIQEEHARNKPFVAAFQSFLDLCRTSLDPNMSRTTVNEMLVQHLLTERLFRTIFNNSDFTRRNAIAAEIETVIQALTSRAFNRYEFLKSLDRFYIAIENAARNLDDWSEKQHFINIVYERFFQGFSVKAEGQQMSMFVEENTERVKREKDAQIMVVIGNPPYNVGQKSENDNNKNRKYQVIDGRVRETYAKDSRASNKNALGDVYVKFFRWAVDRLQGRDGVVCFVSNNSFVEQIAFDGLRKHLLEDFTQVYHIDLHGNVRVNPKLSGTTYNVFGIQLGVGITIAVRSSQHQEKQVFYHRVPEFWRKSEKLAFLSNMQSLNNIEWETLQPDMDCTWITEGMQPEFRSFFPLGTKETKSKRGAEPTTIFLNYGGGVKTNRDEWTYDFSKSTLESKIRSFLGTYNSEFDRWRRRGSDTTSIDNFVLYDDTKIKWSGTLKSYLERSQSLEFANYKIRQSIYRPFCKQWLYFERGLVERVYQFPQIFPIPHTEVENIIICVTGIGADHQTLFAASSIVDTKCGINGNSAIQCFPYYAYTEDGSNRRENITDWSLAQFQAKYGSDVTKWDIFHYVYALLHHPQYRERYAENLKRDLPHIPLLQNKEAFLTCVHIGKRLMELHLHYEQAKEHPLQWLENQDIPFSWHVKKMRLTTDKTAIVVNESLTLAGIPSECFAYRLGNRSALDWIIDQYQVSEDKRSGIVSDPNNSEDEEYIVRLVGKVVTVSIETMKLVDELAKEVKQEEWLGQEG